MKDFRQEAKQILQAVGDCLETGDTNAAEFLIEKALRETFQEKKRKKTDKQRLLKQIRKVDDIFTSTGTLDWEQKYDTIFKRAREKINPLMKKLGLHMDYYDPDTSYEEDVTAYVQALRDLKPEVEKLHRRKHDC